MSKRELIEAVAAGSGDSETATAGLLNAVIEIIVGVLSHGDIVQLVGLGSFSVDEGAAVRSVNLVMTAGYRDIVRRMVDFERGDAD